LFILREIKIRHIFIGGSNGFDKGRDLRIKVIKILIIWAFGLNKVEVERYHNTNQALKDLKFPRV